MASDPDLLAALASLENMNEEDLAAAINASEDEPSELQSDATFESVTTEQVDGPGSEGEASGPQLGAEPSNLDGGEEVAESILPEVQAAASPPETSAEPEPIDAGALAVDLYRAQYGADPTPEAMVEVLGVAADIRALTPEQRAQVQAWARGDTTQPIAPQPPIHQNQGQFPVVPPTAPLSSPTVPPGIMPGTPAAVTPAPPLPDYWDDETKAVFLAQQERQAQLEAQLAATAAQQQQLTQQQLIAQQTAQREQEVIQITEAERTWREQNPEVSDYDYLILSQMAAKSPIFPSLVAQNGGSIIPATHQLLNVTLAGIPDMHARIQNAKAQAAADRAQADATRKQKAASLSGGASSTPKTTPQTKAERDAAAIQEMATIEL